MVVSLITSWIHATLAREDKNRPCTTGGCDITPDDLTFLSSSLLSLSLSTDAPFSGRASCCITDPSAAGAADSGGAVRNQKLGTFTRVTSGDSFRIPEIRRRGEVRETERERIYFQT